MLPTPLLKDENSVIVLDDKVYMAPNLREKISGGSAVVTGLDGVEEARDIAIVLRAGALPASVNVAEERMSGRRWDKIRSKRANSA